MPAAQETYSSRKHSRSGFLCRNTEEFVEACKFGKLQRKELIYDAGATGTRSFGPMDLPRKAVQSVGWPGSDRGVRADGIYPCRYCGQTSGGSPARAGNSREMDSERNHRPSHR